MKYVNILGLCLYAILGIVLALCGISITREPIMFFSVWACVVAIDMNSAYVMFKAMQKQRYTEDK